MDRAQTPTAQDRAIVYAALSNDMGKLKELVAQGANPEAVFGGYTPLLAASEFGHVSVVDYLINQLSVDVNKMLDTDGTSPGSNIGWFVFEKCPVLAEVLSGPDSTTPTRVPTMANEESDTAAYMTILDLFKSKGMLIKAPPEPSNGAQKGNTTENAHRMGKAELKEAMERLTPRELPSLKSRAEGRGSRTGSTSHIDSDPDAACMLGYFYEKEGEKAEGSAWWGYRSAAQSKLEGRGGGKDSSTRRTNEQGDAQSGAQSGAQSTGAQSGAQSGALSEAQSGMQSGTRTPKKSALGSMVLVSHDHDEDEVADSFGNMVMNFDSIPRGAGQTRRDSTASVVSTVSEAWDIFNPDPDSGPASRRPSVLSTTSSVSNGGESRKNKVGGGQPKEPKKGSNEPLTPPQLARALADKLGTVDNESESDSRKADADDDAAEPMPTPDPGSEMAMAAIVYYSMAANYDSQTSETALKRTGSVAGSAPAPLPPSVSMSLSRLAAMHGDGRGVPVNEAEAARVHAFGARVGDPQSQFEYGFVLCHGRGVAVDEAAALRWYLAAADQQHEKAAYNAALQLLAGKCEDPAKAAQYMLKAARGGLPAAQCCYARMLETGRGVELDGVAAIRWYIASGTLEAHYSLARLYYSGHAHVAQSAVDAELWFIRAADHDGPKVGNLSETPARTVRDSMPLRVEYTCILKTPCFDLPTRSPLRQAADAQYSLACILDYSNRIEESVKYYTRAATNGHRGAQKALLNYLADPNRTAPALPLAIAAASLSSPLKGTTSAGNGMAVGIDQLRANIASSGASVVTGTKSKAISKSPKRSLTTGFETKVAVKGGGAARGSSVAYLGSASSSVVSYRSKDAAARYGGGQESPRSASRPAGGRPSAMAARPGQAGRSLLKASPTAQQKKEIREIKGVYSHGPREISAAKGTGAQRTRKGGSADAGASDANAHNGSSRATWREK